MSILANLLKHSILTLALITTAHAQPTLTPTQRLQEYTDNYLQNYANEEHISAVSLSAYSPFTQKIITVNSGTTEFGGGKPVAPDNLYQIGSITKSFISAILLQLEADPKNNFSIDDPLKKYLPQYEAWGDVTIKQLLNMTSGIPSYIEDGQFADDMEQNPMRQWTPEELVDYVYPKPLLRDNNGFHFSNTNYILAGMIITKLTGHTVAEEMELRFLAANRDSLSLRNTFYISHLYPNSIASRLAHGYVSSFCVFPFDTDVTDYSMSWMGAAGANISNTEDIIRWVRALFTVTKVLPAKQLAELKALVSAQTGQPIDAPTADDAAAYGLGIAASYNFGSPKDIIYYYEGGTLGYRAFYLYVPTQDIIVSVAVNSSVDDDHLAELVTDAYFYLLKQSSAKQAVKGKLLLKKLPFFKIHK